jgi:hypothetical protein
MDDGDSVAEMLRRSGTQTTFGFLGWTYERELLTLIVDVLNQMHATMVQVNSADGKRPSVEMLRRPVTALNKVEAQQGILEHQERVAKFLPGR